MSHPRAAFALMFLLLPTAAYAYVDPGILGMIYQLGYAVIFGVVTAFVLRPWSYLRAKISKGSEVDPSLETQEKEAEPNTRT